MGSLAGEHYPTGVLDELQFAPQVLRDFRIGVRAMLSIQEVAAELAQVIADEHLAVHPPELSEGDARMTMRSESSWETFVMERAWDGDFLIGEPSTRGGFWTQAVGVQRRPVDPNKGRTEALTWARRFKA